MATVRVLGDRRGRLPSIGLTSRTQRWELNKAELKDFTTIHGNLAIQELRVEQKQGSLLRANRFVDGSQFKTEGDVRLGGVITYDDVESLADVMLFIDQQLWLENAKFKDTGALQSSATWRHNGRQVGPGGVPILDQGDQLVVYGNIRYAKYQEVGTSINSAKWVYRKVAARTRRRFGRAFIIEHKMLQTAQIPKRYVTVTKRSRRGASFQMQIYTKGYYKERWKNSFPAIRIVQRQGVKYRVQ